ncbi:MAG TPA: tetratricopeptide repeat protein [Burkholderiales bacterium]|nr:tetratricopeptide repeat protein [Burkholderiales bacterium]
MNFDRYGLALATASSQAAAAYRSGVDLLLSACPGADARFEEAVAHDPGFALAHAGLARHLQIYGRIPEAKNALAIAGQRVSGASARERAHVHILGLAIDGQAVKALEALLAHLEAHPRDALVFSLALGAFGLYGFSGRADHDAARLALCRRMARHYDDDWWFLTHLGWSHTEAGALDAGRRFTERALELRRENAHGAHAYVHYFVESGGARDGERFLEEWLPGYEPGGALYGHIRWHQALWRLEEGDLEAVAAIYRQILRPSLNASPPINVISDCASLLWRISLGNAAAEWREVADYGANRFPGTTGHFIEWHLAMAAAGAGDLMALERRLGELREAPPGPVLRAVCSAFRAFAAGDYAGVVALLEPMRQEFKRMGGSGAQRQVLFDTLAAARARLATG